MVFFSVVSSSAGLLVSRVGEDVVVVVVLMWVLVIREMLGAGVRKVEWS